MGGTCVLIYQDLDTSFNSWNEISTFELESASIKSATVELIDKKIDESISAVAIDLTDSSITALALIGIFLNLDAATLLGNSKAGLDKTWIKECEEIRITIKNNRNLKNNKEKLLEGLLIPKGGELLKIIQQATLRKTPVFLIGDLAIALGYLVARANSQAKDLLHIASRNDLPGLVKAVESVQIPSINIPAGTNRARGLAIALLSHV